MSLNDRAQKPLIYRDRSQLEPRYEELEDLYLWHREAVERLVRDPDRFTPITLAHLAAGQAALQEHEQSASPYRITAAATLPWARSRIGLARRAAARLDVYFEAMHIVVEQIDLGLAEIADWLRQALEAATGDGTSFSCPEVEREDES